MKPELKFPLIISANKIIHLSLRIVHPGATGPGKQTIIPLRNPLHYDLLKNKFDAIALEVVEIDGNKKTQIEISADGMMSESFTDLMDGCESDLMEFDQPHFTEDQLRLANQFVSFIQNELKSF